VSHMDSQPAEDAVLEVGLAVRRVLIRAALAEGLSSPQAVLVWVLAPGTTIPMRQIAQVLECDAANVTGLVGGLVRRRLIRRATDPSDRRVKRLSLTPKGIRLRSRLATRLLRPRDWIANLGPSEQKALAHVLELLESETAHRRRKSAF
jgi:DNA-binding MarR family transcriptional regulator